jgi:hypothetical protein
VRPGTSALLVCCTDIEVTEDGVTLAGDRAGVVRATDGLAGYLGGVPLPACVELSPHAEPTIA